MSKANRTRQYIIDKTAPVFNTRGYNGTSLVDLTTATGLSKGALYGNFGNKEEIAVETFRYAMRKTREAAKAKLDKAKSFREKITSLFDFYEQFVFNSPVAGGCPLMNNAVEADDNNRFLKKYVTGEIRTTIEFIESLLIQGRRAGEFKPDVDTKELALVFFCSIEGAIVISRILSSNVPMKSVIKHCKNILEQISQ